MSKVNGTAQSNPEDLVQTFAACGNFPKDRVGVLMLAQALKRAADDFRVPMADIVRECSDSSAWCPTPRDIRTVAISMRDVRTRAKEGNQHRKWEQIYGPADPDWSAALIGALVGDKHSERMRKIHLRAIRDMLFYTEGDGVEMGDRQFWEEQARPHDLLFSPELVAQVRAAGGWQTERELQTDWIDGIIAERKKA